MLIRGLTDIATDTQLSRRSLLRGMTSLGIILAAPKVVRASSLMDIRGVPLIRGEFIPCEGQTYRDDEEPDLLEALVRQQRNVPYPNVNIAGRQYGGSGEDRKFSVPDFRFGYDPYSFGARAQVSYELDRGGNLYMSVTPIESVRDLVASELRTSMSESEVSTLMSSERVKI